MYKYHQEIQFLENEYWWGGIVDEGINMPFSNFYSLKDINENNYNNQVTSFFISSSGRFIYSSQPVRFKIDNNVLIIDSINKIKVDDSCKNIKEAYYKCAKKNFINEAKYPCLEMFKIPQYNTWIEMNYHVSEEKILNYAKSIIDNGFRPGILMIDDGWQEDYGTWDFNMKNFKNPKSMIKKLHKMGFKVMLWVVPCVSPDSYIFRQGEAENIFYKERKSKDTLIMKWWDGNSAVLDLTNKKANEWFKKQLDYLQNEYGVDGFKFDGADPHFYPKNGVFDKNMARIHQARLYSSFASNYNLNEMRACFNCQGMPLAQRLCDKAHSWNDRGINTLIPNGIAMSLLGYVYCCPDMIGGGLVGDFVNNNYQNIDEKLFVRYAQVSTFFPMMQFSLGPWKVLNEENLKIVKKCCDIHESIYPYIKELVKKASIDHSLIIRPLIFNYPNKIEYATIKDEFMLGSKYLIAPITSKDTYKRDVVLPPGKWLSDLNEEFIGNQTITIDVPLSRIPYFKKIK